MKEFQSFLQSMRKDKIKSKLDSRRVKHIETEKHNVMNRSLRDELE